MHYLAPQFPSRCSFFKLFVASEDSTPTSSDMCALSIAEQCGHFPGVFLMYPGLGTTCIPVSLILKRKLAIRPLS